MTRRFESKVDTWLVVVIAASFAISVLATAPTFLVGMWWVAIPVVLIYLSSFGYSGRHITLSRGMN